METKSTKSAVKHITKLQETNGHRRDHLVPLFLPKTTNVCVVPKVFTFWDALGTTNKLLRKQSASLNGSQGVLLKGQRKTRRSIRLSAIRITPAKSANHKKKT